jgi:Leucine-rich repeat (LRR) protein
MKKTIFYILAAVTLTGAGCANNTEQKITENNKPPATQQVAKPMNLSGQNLTSVPSYVFQLKSATELNLSNNKLTGALPAEVRNMKELTVLNLSNNQFTGIPAEVGQLSKLEILDVSNNKITGLPLEIGNLKNLKTLNLKGNDFSKIDLEQIRKNIPNATIIEK